VVVFGPMSRRRWVGLAGSIRNPSWWMAMWWWYQHKLIRLSGSLLPVVSSFPYMVGLGPTLGPEETVAPASPNDWAARVASTNTSPPPERSDGGGGSPPLGGETEGVVKLSGTSQTGLVSPSGSARLLAEPPPPGFSPGGGRQLAPQFEG